MFTMQHYTALMNTLRLQRIQVTTNPELTPQQRVEHHRAIGDYQLRLMDLLEKDNPKFQRLAFIGAASEHTPTRTDRR